MIEINHAIIILLIFIASHTTSAAETKSGRGGSNSSAQKTYAPTTTCYPYIKEVVQEDKQNSSLGLIKSMHGACRQNTNDAEVKKHFGDSKTFAEFIGTERYADLGPQNKFNSNRCNEEKDVPVHEIASRYYYMMNRVSLGQESTAGRIAAIGRVLGDQSVLNRVGCSESDLPNVKKVCDEAKKCSSPEGALDKMANSTETTLSQIAEMERELKKEKAILTSMRGGVYKFTEEEKKNTPIKIMMLELQIQTLKSFIPWTEGEEYKNAIKLKRPIKDAIAKQLTEDRKTLVSQYSLLNKHKSCIANGSSRGNNCSFDDIVELAENTPNPVSRTNTTKDPKLKNKVSYTNLEIDAQNCVFNGKVDQIKTSDVINGAAFQAGLTVVTVGLGSAAILGRVLTSRALVAEKTAENLVKGANVARVAIDGGMFLKDAKDAISTCEKFAAQTPSPPKTDSCQIASIYESTPQIDSYKECLVAVTFAGIDGGRLALGKLVSKLADKRVAQLSEDTQKRLANFLEAQSGGKTATLTAASDLDNLGRFKAAENLLNRGEIPLNQRKAILAAHEVGGSKGYFEYTKAELKEKMKILTDAGFSRSEADKLIRKGITGQFSGDNAKLAQQGLLDSQLAERNKADELGDYFEDARRARAAGMDSDKLRNSYDNELTKLGRQKTRKGITEEEIRKIDDQIAAIEKKREDLYKATFGKADRTLGDHVDDVRASIANKTEEIDRVRTQRYGDSVSLDKPDLMLNDRLRSRQSMFETEAFLDLQRNAGDPSKSIATFRRAVKDVNEQQNMGFMPKTANDAERTMTLRAVAQDYNGFKGAEIEALLKSRGSALEEGRPFLRGDIQSPKSFVSSNVPAMNNEVWQAYVKYSQRVSDQQILNTVMDNASMAKKYGLDRKKLSAAEDIYVEARERAYKELSTAVNAMYKDSKTAAQVLKGLTNN